MTAEFEAIRNDPDLQAERGPGGTLIFLDGDQYCVVGPGFVSTEEGDGYAFGSTSCGVDLADFEAGFFEALIPEATARFGYRLRAANAGGRSTSLRSTARPPVSTMRMKICASCGRVDVGALASETGKVATPLASASGRFSL